MPAGQEPLLPTERKGHVDSAQTFLDNPSLEQVEAQKQEKQKRCELQKTEAGQ
jgi:hypothetical protein